MAGRLSIVLSLILATSFSCKDVIVNSAKQELPPPSIVDIVIPAQEPELYKGFNIVREEEDPYRCVGKVYDNNEEFIGSAIQIDKNLVITAAHCIEDTNLKYFEVGGKKYNVIKSIMHEKYKIGNRVVNDIGILILSEPTCITEFPEISYSPKDLTRFENLTTVGFSREIKKSSKQGSFYYYGVLIEDPFVFKFNSTQDVHIWFGDSGGAIFEENGKLVGIISSMSIVDYSIIDMSGVPFYYYEDWIKNIKKNNKDILFD